jgi:hypothetical protein
VQDDSIVVPNIPEIHITNTTGTGIHINPCTDIAFSLVSENNENIRIKNLDGQFPEFCETMVVQNGQTAQIPL